jgi:hypothetical protein
MVSARWLVVPVLLLASATPVLGACPAPLRALPKGQADMSHARAVAVGPPAGSASGVLRFSDVKVNGEPFVMDVQWRRNGKPGAIVRGSVTPSAAPTISNLQAQVFPGDVASCGAEFPDRVQLTFDYEDCNGDLLGGFAAAETSVTMRDGAGPFGGVVIWDFFDWGIATLSSPTAATGTASLKTCWGNVGDVHFAVRARDAAGNVSAETLAISVVIPAP